MTKQEIKRYIIRNFLERGYSIYTSITDETFCIERDGVCGTCRIILTTIGSKNRIILDLRSKDHTRFLHEGFCYIIGFDISTKNIWLIPVDDIADNRTLCMSDAKIHYLLMDDEHGVPLTVSKKQAIESVERIMLMKQSTDKVIKNQKDEKKEIDTLLDRKEL